MSTLLASQDFAPKHWPDEEGSSPGWVPNMLLQLWRCSGPWEGLLSVVLHGPHRLLTPAPVPHLFLLPGLAVPGSQERVQGARARLRPASPRRSSFPSGLWERGREGGRQAAGGCRGRVVFSLPAERGGPGQPPPWPLWLPSHLHSAC